MVTFKCTKTKCSQKDLEIHFSGNPETAECGGCGAILEAKNLRDDLPEISTL
jgi:hypothetical protein